MVNFPFPLLNKAICLRKVMKNITILQNISTLDQEFMIHIPTTKNLFSGLRYYNHNEKVPRKFTNMDMGFIMNL